MRQACAGEVLGRRAACRDARDTTAPRSSTSCVDASLRAISVWLPMPPMRTARSSPSSTMSTARSESSTSNPICGCSAAKSAMRRREVADAEGDRRGEPQRAARNQRRRRRRLLGLGEVGEQLHAALVERLPALGQRQPARRPVEEPRREMRLELGDVTRHRRRRHAELVGRAGEAPLLDDPGEHGQRANVIHGRLHIIPNIATIYP